MFEKDLFEMIEETKVDINKNRKNKKQSIKDFLKECEIEGKSLLIDKELILK